MVEIEPLLVNIVVMLVSALLLGEVFKRLKLPALVGHLLAGVIIGPSLFNIVQPSDSFDVIVNLSIFFLMFLAGLELRPEEIKKAGRGAIILSVLAFVVPFAGGFVISDMLLGFQLLTSLFIGLTLAITAVPVSAAVLMEFGLLQGKMGSTIMTAGIIDDILSLITLSIIIQLAQSGDGLSSSSSFELAQIAVPIINITAFLGGIFLLIYVLRKMQTRLRQKIIPVGEKLQTREIGLGILLLSAFGLGLLAEVVGLHFIVGSFFAGLIIYREIIGKEKLEKVSTVIAAITFGFFSPIFFAFIGVEFHAQSILEHTFLVVILLAVAIVGKIGGGFIGAKLAGFSNSESGIIGYLVNSRGMVELVIATIGLDLGIIDTDLFTVVVAIGFITTAMAPVMARIALRRSSNNLQKQQDDSD